MIAALTPYPKMRDSGVGWLGEVPEHWEVRRLKYAVSFRGGGTPSKANPSFWSGPVPWVSPKDMTRTRLNDTADHITNDAVAASAASIVAPRAVLVVVRSGILRRTIPVAINTVPMALNQDMKALCPENGIVASEYLHALIQGNQSLLLREWTKHGATVESIEHRLLANSRIPIPPLPEQDSIARFLDHADQRIRRYIRAKERLIELLDEQKQAIIHKAVTGQIDVRTGQPYQVYKDSGAEWLGEVPEHWEVRRLKYAVSFRGGGTPSKANPSFWSGPVPWVSPKDMTRTRLNDTADHITNDAVAASAASIVAPRAVLVVVRSGILRRTIPVAINTVPMALNQDMKALCPENGIVASEYLHALIQGNQSLLLREWTKHGATVESIEHRLLANSRIPIPPLPEQDSIARFLDDVDRRTSARRAAGEREIGLLREYRTRLTADVVTGKLDVREAAAKLPEADPADGGGRGDTIKMESHSHSTDHDITKESIS